MQNQLRERMFADINYPDLKKRCLDVITQLKLDADLLVEENMKAIQGANETWNILEIEEKKKEMEEKKAEQLESTVLPRAEQKGGGDADSEQLAALQEAMEIYTDSKVEEVRVRYKAELGEFQKKTISQLDKIEINIGQMNNANSSFVNALKEEVELSSAAQRKLNMETMQLIKGISATLKKMRDQQNVMSEDNSKMRHTLSLTVH